MATASSGTAICSDAFAAGEGAARPASRASCPARTTCACRPARTTAPSGRSSSAASPPACRPNLRLHRFHVAGSGRVIGRSDDLLEPFCGVFPDDEDRTAFHVALAALAPDRRRLYLVCARQPALGSTGTGAGQAADAGLPPNTEYVAISAHGGIWVPAVWAVRCLDCAFTYRLFVYRLVDGDGSWAEVNSADFPYKLSLENPYGGYLLQGYAVINDRFILLSSINSSFFCFDCAAGTLTRVVTDGGEGGESRTHSHRYVPISGRGVHVCPRRR
ncbi:hypothetical protein BAE44_0022103 [Dichanthelium oligosanthes]|uniref:Uncharacterized protein n=1 Tax=Dichanthelium oligosanthes TaxID=888268 RepID=A0A1E5UVG3_9POAL|nr:hypothetical protein BAE44_0022103 [Dichanthelium oligosanthes]